MQLPEAAQSHLTEAFADDTRMIALASRILTTFPDLGAERYSEEDIAQLLRGFSGLALEKLGGGTGEARDLFLHTAIPAVMALGETSATLARSCAMFGILIAEDLCRDLEGPERDAVATWVAAFFGDHTYDVVMIAEGKE